MNEMTRWCLLTHELPSPTIELQRLLRGKFHYMWILTIDTSVGCFKQTTDMDIYISSKYQHVTLGAIYWQKFSTIWLTFSHLFCSSFNTSTPSRSNWLAVCEVFDINADTATWVLEGGSELLLSIMKCFVLWSLLATSQECWYWEQPGFYLCLCIFKH
jgi:hypothetical protein